MYTQSCIETPTACKHTVSGTISLAVSAFFSPFPHGTCPLSVIQMYLALADGAAGFIQDFTGPVLLRIPLPPRPLRLPAFHRLWGCFPGSFDSLQVQILWPYYPPDNKVVGGLGWVPFARRYLGHHYCFLLLLLLRCFSSEGSPLRFASEISPARMPGMGFPIRIPADQRFFAAPRRFSQLSTSFIATVCLGIHRVPFSTFPCMACTTPGRARPLSKQ